MNKIVPNVLEDPHTKQADSDKNELSIIATVIMNIPQNKM